MIRNAKMRPAATFAALTGIGALLLGGCASGDGGEPESDGDLTPVTLTLNFLAGGPNSGFMVALENGYYEEVGLDVTIQEGQGSNSTASLVDAGNSDFGYVDAPSAMSVASQGGDLQIVAPILQTNGFSVMSLTETGVSEIADLEGLSVAVQPGTAQASLFEAVLEVNGVDPSSVDMVNIDPSALIGSLLQGSVDAITAGADNQGVQLASQGADFDEIMYRDAGVPTVGLSMVTSSAYAEENPDIVEAFVDASLRGWDDAREDPAAAAAIVAEQFPQAADAGRIEQELGVDIPLMCAEGAENMGLVPEDGWSATYDLLVEYLDLPSDAPIEDYYTTDYLPEELPAC